MSNAPLSPLLPAEAFLAQRAVFRLDPADDPTAPGRAVPRDHLEGLWGPGCHLERYGAPLEAPASPLAVPAATTARADRTADSVTALEALEAAARATGTWVSTRQVGDALQARGHSLSSDDANAIRVRLRGLATARRRGVAALRAPLVRLAQRTIGGRHHASFWWPAALGEPVGPPGVASTAAGIRELVRLATHDLGRPATVRAALPEALVDYVRLLEGQAGESEAVRQLLELPWAPFDGVCVGPKTAVPATTFAPLIAEAADLLGEPEAATSDAWLAAVPRLTPHRIESGGSGRALLVDRMGGRLAVWGDAAPR